MADDDGGRLRGWVSNGQLLITLLTAAFSFYISVQQNEIKKGQDKLSLQQQEMKNKQEEIKTKQDGFGLVVTTKAETEKWAERTLSYVKELSMPVSNSKQKEAIIINLMDAIALANVSQEGTTDRQKILQTPLWIALATGNVEALGLIGNADNRRNVWFNLATGSGDATVRKTAMEALARSSASEPLKHLRQIYQLSEELNNSDILDSAIEQIGRVVRVMERHPDPARFREDDLVKPLVSRLEALQTSLAVDALNLEYMRAVAGLEVPQTGLAADAAALNGDEKTVDERSATLQRQTLGVKRALAFLRGSGVATAVSAEDVQKITSTRGIFNALFNAWNAAPDSEAGKKALDDAKAILEKLRPNHQLEGKAVFEALDEEIRRAEPGSAELAKVNAAFSGH